MSIAIGGLGEFEFAIEVHFEDRNHRDVCMQMNNDESCIDHESGDCDIDIDQYELSISILRRICL